MIAISNNTSLDEGSQSKRVAAEQKLPIEVLTNLGKAQCIHLHGAEHEDSTSSQPALHEFAPHALAQPRLVTSQDPPAHERTSKRPF